MCAVTLSQRPSPPPPPPNYISVKGLREDRSANASREERVGSEGTRTTALGLSWHYMRLKPCLDNSQIHRL